MLGVVAALHALGCQNRAPATSAAEPRPDPAQASRASPPPFLTHLPPGIRLPNLHDAVNLHLLADYGAVFVAQGVAPPPVLVFADEAEVERWQSSVPTGRATIKGIPIELQVPALQAFLDARAEAKRMRLEISLPARDAARRDYARTVVLWQRRIDAGLRHWQEKGRITRAEARRIRALAPHEQIVEIERLEKQGIFFSQLFNKPILDSAAPPGASQHLSMLAIDVKEHTQAKVRTILARHQWFPTVACDLPHFTYLGVPENRLPALGLKQVTCGKRQFWVPNLGSESVKSPPD